MGIIPSLGVTHSIHCSEKHFCFCIGCSAFSGLEGLPSLLRMCPCKENYTLAPLVSLLSMETSLSTTGEDSRSSLPQAPAGLCKASLVAWAFFNSSIVSWCFFSLFSLFHPTYR